VTVRARLGWTSVGGSPSVEAIPLMSHRKLPIMTTSNGTKLEVLLYQWQRGKTLQSVWLIAHPGVSSHRACAPPSGL